MPCFNSIRIVFSGSSKSANEPSVRSGIARTLVGEGRKEKPATRRDRAIALTRLPGHMHDCGGPVDQKRPEAGSRRACARLRKSPRPGLSPCTGNADRHDLRVSPIAPPSVASASSFMAATRREQRQCAEFEIQDDVHCRGTAGFRRFRSRTGCSDSSRAQPAGQIATRIPCLRNSA